MSLLRDWNYSDNVAAAEQCPALSDTSTAMYLSYWPPTAFTVLTNVSLTVTLLGWILRTELKHTEEGHFTSHFLLVIFRGFWFNSKQTTVCKTRSAKSMHSNGPPFLVCSVRQLTDTPASYFFPLDQDEILVSYVLRLPYSIQEVHFRRCTTKAFHLRVPNTRRVHHSRWGIWRKNSENLENVIKTLIKAKTCATLQLILKVSLEY
jgi:hypothetical protein